MFQIYLGALLLSAVVAAAWWTRIRQMWLRQDIYDLRDELFDTMAKAGTLDDPAYRSARSHLNYVAQCAGDLSLPVFLYLLHAGVKGKAIESSENEFVQRTVQETIENCATRIVRFLVLETGAGLLMSLSALVLSLYGAMKQRFLILARRWILSLSAEQMSEIHRVPRRS